MLRGDVNGLRDNNKIIAGWAWNPEQPDAHVLISVVSSGGHTASILADEPRKDLAKFGQGDHSFRFEIPEEWLSPDPTRLTFTFAETGQVLPRGVVQVPGISASSRLTISQSPAEVSAAAPVVVRFADEPSWSRIDVLANAAYALSLRVYDPDAALDVRAQFNFATGGRDDGLRLFSASGAQRRSSIKAEEQQSDGPYRLFRAEFKISPTLSGWSGSFGVLPGHQDRVRLPVEVRPVLRPATGVSATEALGSVSISPVLLLEQISPSLLTGVERGTFDAGHGQLSFAVPDGGSATPQADAPQSDRAETARVRPRATSARTPRILAVASPDFCAALSQVALVTPIEDKTLGNDLLSSRFDALFLQSSEVSTATINKILDPARFSELIEIAADIGLPIALFLDEAAFRDEIQDLILQRASVLLHTGEMSLPEAASSKTVLEVAPLIDVSAYNPFTARSAQPDDTFAGNGLVLVDGWTDANRAAEGADPAALRRLLPRLVVIDSRHDVSVFRVRSAPLLRWNMLGAASRAQKLEMLKQTSSLLLLKDDPLRTAEALACACLPMRPDEIFGRDLDGNAISTDPTGGTGVQPRALQECKRDKHLHDAACGTLRKSSPRPGLTRLLATLYPGRPFDWGGGEPTVCVVSVSMRPWQLDNVLANFNRQTYAHKQHVIVIHGPFDTPTIEKIEARLAAEANTSVHFLPDRVTLGSCLNFGARQGSHQYVAKFDDDDYYAPAYLDDAITLITADSAKIYTQPAGLIYLEETQSLIRMRKPPKHSYGVLDASCYRGFVGSGGTLIIASDVLERIGFTTVRRGGADSDFAMRAVAAGERIHLGSYFNYVFVRRADKSSHTWTTHDMTFSRDADVIARGPDVEQCLRDSGLLVPNTRLDESA